VLVPGEEGKVSVATLLGVVDCAIIENKRPNASQGSTVLANAYPDLGIPWGALQVWELG
jgi:hypothetical protein